MKKIIVTLILGLILAAGLKAQTITLPDFSNETVIMYTYTLSMGKYQPYAFLTDGTTNYTTDLKAEAAGKDAQGNGHFPQVADMMNQLKKQGYKLIQAITTQGTYVEYYFQKD